LEQLQEIIEDEKITDNSAMEVQEIVEDGEEVLDPDNSTAVLHTVRNSNNNDIEH